MMTQHQKYFRHNIVWYANNNVTEEHTASIFRLDPEDWGWGGVGWCNLLFSEVGPQTADYTAS
jgi:hypothetical protein